MIKIGITGGIGSGKSTISDMLRKKGFSIIDADIVAREVLKIYPEILQKVKEQFGKEFFNEKGELKRKEFGNYIFAVEERRKKYENIIMPFIIEYIFINLDKFKEEGKQVCFVDAATLIENNLHKHMDVNILVWVDSKTQIERVKNRDHLTEEQVIDRISSQMPLEDKKKVCDFIIDNSKTLEYTEKELYRALREIGKKYRGVECLKL
ncbi:dephospho-CoA kinase [Clostridium aciditolerans]|uniref:Dephospho-CoA kinase n=1 Tax=Clostridium aciditolerans TaxID=339861 RepID=A0A934HWI1_9CLOT|nr:dephospho-CoA kinase [Clostridium aciditolerans]